MDDFLRQMIEKQLVQILKNQHFPSSESLKLDWSQSVPEGNEIEIFGEPVDCRSDVLIIDEYSNIVGCGWYGFLIENDSIKAYWKYLKSETEE